MLTGSAAYSMDRKGRLVVPAWMREELGDPLVLLAGPEDSALLLSRTRWEAVEAVHGRDPAFRREVLPFAYEEAVGPTTGRVLIRHPLRERNGWSRYDSLGVAGCGPAALIVDEERLIRQDLPDLPGWLTGEPEPHAEAVTLRRGEVLLLLDLFGDLWPVAGREAQQGIDYWRRTLTGQMG